MVFTLSADDPYFISNGGWIQLNYQINCSGVVIVYPIDSIDHLPVSCRTRRGSTS